MLQDILDKIQLKMQKKPLNRSLLIIIDNQKNRLMKSIDLIILNEIQDFHYLDKKEINIDQLLVITKSPAVAHNLKKRNLKYFFYNNFLNSKAIDENLTLSNEFLIKLAELDYKYQFMNVPIFKILRGVLSPAYINNIFNSLTIVSKILKNYRVENFILPLRILIIIRLILAY